MTVTTTTATDTNRETWLLAAVEALRPMFTAIEATIPAVKVSCGFPKSKGRANVIGQCWSTLACEEAVSQVFISPEIDSTDQVLSTLVHELVHAVDDCQSGHKGAFGKMARALGLEGKLTATVAGDDLAVALKVIQDDLGDYPHSALGLVSSANPKQGTRMLKVECPADGYVVRTTAKWLAMGLPTCPCGEEMVAV